MTLVGGRTAFGVRTTRADPRNRVHWLLEFARIDLGTISTRDRQQWRDTLAVFVPPRMILPHTRGPSITQLETGAPNYAQMLLAQRELRQGMARLFGVPPKPWVVSHIRNSRTLVRRATAIESVFWSPSFRKRFLMAVADVLEAFGEWIRACVRPECRRLFLAVKRQRYCSGKCSQTVRSRRFWSDHRDELLEKRRQQYEAKIRRTHPHARVRRRRSATPPSPPEETAPAGAIAQDSNQATVGRAE